jgi:hypothetical protein
MARAWFNFLFGTPVRSIVTSLVGFFILTTVYPPIGWYVANRLIEALAPLFQLLFSLFILVLVLGGLARAILGGFSKPKKK